MRFWGIDHSSPCPNLLKIHQTCLSWVWGLSHRPEEVQEGAHGLCVCVCVCVCVLKRNRSHFIFPREAELSFGFETFSSKCPLAIGGNRSLFSQQAISDSFVTRQTEACQASLSRGFFRQGCWSGLPFPSPGDIPNPGNEPESPALAGRFFTTSHLGSPVSESRRE